MEVLNINEDEHKQIVLLIKNELNVTLKNYTDCINKHHQTSNNLEGMYYNIIEQIIEYEKEINKYKNKLVCLQSLLQKITESN